MSIHKLHAPKTSKIWYKALNAVGCYDLYALRIVINVGKEDRKGGLGELMEVYKILGFNITFDNFLRLWLLPEIYLRRTLKPLVISDFINVKFHLMFNMEKNFSLYPSKFVFTSTPENIMLLSYKPNKREVVYLFSSVLNVQGVSSQYVTL